MNFNHKDITSSQIKSIGYHPESKTLEVIFKGGGTYQYTDVPKETHEAMLTAPSAGKYAHTKIE